jgi:DNA polymerase III alpha subunit
LVPTLPRVDVPESARLAAERRYTGVYLSGHPLDGVPGPDLRVRLVGRETALVPVIVDRVFEKKTKSGEWMTPLC